MPLSEQVKSISPLFREALTVHLILMAGGVNPDDLFVIPDCVAPSGEENHLGVAVVYGGTPVFTVTVGKCDLPKGQFEEEWTKAVGLLHTLSPEEAREMRDSTAIREHAVRLLAAFQQKLRPRAST